jgi:hypothetical protein
MSSKRLTSSDYRLIKQALRIADEDGSIHEFATAPQMDWLNEKLDALLSGEAEIMVEFPVAVPLERLETLAAKARALIDDI